MRIDRIELFHVAMPLISPWRTAYGEDAVVESVLCRMSSGSVDAWGEACPLAAPCYSPEHATGVFQTAARWMAPRILGQTIDSGADLQQRLSLFKGNPFAKAVLDCTWWNLQARLANQPLHHLLGATRNEVPVGDDYGVADSVDELLTKVGWSVETGFPRIKLKYRPGWDLPMLREVRRAFPDAVLHIDCNSGYTLRDRAMFQTIDELQLAMIEQPLNHDDLVDHATLQRAIQTPVCLDESIASVRHAEQAIALQSCRYVNIKPGRVGGLTNAIRIHDLCQEAGIPCWVGGMLESAVGVGQCIALAMLDNFTYPADIFPSQRYYRDDLSEHAITLTNDGPVPSVRALSRMPEPDPQRLKRMTQQSVVVGDR
ncbi:MAG: o-succinylbenzoate synthase [Planctomycetota bacterium]|nr:MAG: o-succinylbenzoate synthase [Planctomycetota bacterium]